jgi:GT2 family glycosyltransferase
MPTVSVIIPTHNRCDVLDKTIWSYLADPVVAEVLVINDGSTDHTEELLRDISQANPKVRYFHTINNGAPAARNLGVQEVSSHSDYVFFGEDDAFIEQQAVSRLVSCIERTGADIAGGIIVPIDSPEAKLRRPKGAPLQQKPVNLNLMRANFRLETAGEVEVPFLHALFLAKRWIFKQVRFDENYFGNAYREETDFCLEAARRGAKIMFCPDSAIFHIEAPHGGQRRITKWAYEKAVLKNNWYFLNKQYAYLKDRYGVATPKIFLQGALLGRRVYLLLRNMVK